MSMPAHRWVSPEEYLAFEEAATGKHEYVDGVVYPCGDPQHPLDPAVVLGFRPEPLSAMAGGTLRHSTMKINLTIAIGPQLRDGPCRLYESDVRVRLSSVGYVYPDLMVVCSDHNDDLRIEIENPTVVFEVLSPATEGYDRGDKFHLYATASSLQHYVLISTRRQSIDVFTRAGDRWTLEQYTPPQNIYLTSIGLELNFVDIYRTVPISSASLVDQE